jgi:hypothetical protein
VGEDHRRGIVGQGLLHHDPRMHAGTVNGALEQHLEGDEPVTVGQECGGEVFVFLLGQPQEGQLLGSLGRGQGLTADIGGVSLQDADRAANSSQFVGCHGHAPAWWMTPRREAA